LRASGVGGVDDSDETLVQRCRGGDGGAFRILVSRYQRPIYNAAYRVLGNAEDASDVTQLAFMEVAERLGEYDPEHKFFSWIYRIALNAALNVLRRNRRREPPPDGDLPGGSDTTDPEWRALDAERSRRIQAALMQLGEDQRTVLTLRHFSDLSYREIALVLEIEETTVKSRLFEARQRLRELLGDLSSP
jgi:RNA polymerase sigma-70 factor (ECF subfamily)